YWNAEKLTDGVARQQRSADSIGRIDLLHAVSGNLYLRVARDGEDGNRVSDRIQSGYENRVGTAGERIVIGYIPAPCLLVYDIGAHEKNGSRLAQTAQTQHRREKRPAQEKVAT